MDNFDKMRSGDRAIYALIMPGNHCYIGQSMYVERQLKQHTYHSSGWGPDMSSVILEECRCNIWEAERIKFAWRWAAHRAGWHVHAAPMGLFEDLPKRVWPEIKEVGEQLTWPPVETVSTRITAYPLVAAQGEAFYEARRLESESLAGAQEAMREFESTQPPPKASAILGRSALARITMATFACCSRLAARFRLARAGR